MEITYCEINAFGHGLLVSVKDSCVAGVVEPRQETQGPGLVEFVLAYHIIHLGLHVTVRIEGRASDVARKCPVAVGRSARNEIYEEGEDEKQRDKNKRY